MKYGILSYCTGNIGDDIQSIAVSQFLPRVDVRVDRDQIKRYKTIDPTIVVMNSWITKNPKHWPPPKGIVPIYFGCCGGNEVFYSDKSLAHLSRYQPVGCRDIYTMYRLRAFGLKAYFSGCATAFIKPYSAELKKHIIFVDVQPTMEKLIPVEIRQKAVRVTNFISGVENSSLQYDKAMEALRYYSSAKLIVTSRLHAALPCIGMKIPVVVLIDPENIHNPYRWLGYEGLFRYFYWGDYIIRPADWENPQITTLPGWYELNRLRLENEIKRVSSNYT